MDNKLKKDIFNSINRFINWLDEYGYESYDVYDYWSSNVGIFFKDLFYKNKIFSPFVFSIQILDSFLPSLRYFFSNKKRFPIADAHFALGFINLYNFTKDTNYLKKIAYFLSSLIENAYKTKNGIGWGLPYDWRTQYGYFKKNTPLITVTPYCFEAFYEAYKITNNKSYYNILYDISKFIAYDLNEINIDQNKTACSYGIYDTSMVINAISYRAYILLLAEHIFKIDEYKKKAIKNINYILSRQNHDGSWYYADDSKVIDNFHTVFVLKNLIKSYHLTRNIKILDSVLAGYDFYLRNFVTKNKSLLHYYKSRYPKFMNIEVYDYAEGIELGLLMKDIRKDAYILSVHLTKEVIKNFQTKKGFYLTRISSFGIKHHIPYLRWPQSQIFYSLTSLLSHTTKNSLVQ